MVVNKLLFVSALCVILSMYGGGFSTVPAYLADLFGTQMVGAIHGRLLTAWATAGILGPVIVNYMRDYQLALGIPREQVYNQTMLILAGLLMIGLLCNLLIRPVADKWFMTAQELAEEKQIEAEHHKHEEEEVGQAVDIESPSHPALVYLAWSVVLTPLLWGIYKTLMNAAKFFG
jgi:MFS family permease